MFDFVDISKILSVMHSIKKSPKTEDVYNILNAMKNMINENLDNMILSIKDIEETVEILSTIIASAINKLTGIL